MTRINANIIMAVFARRTALLLVLLKLVVHADAFVASSPRVIKYYQPLASRLQNSEGNGDIISTRVGSDVSIESYQHKSFKLTYLHKKAAPGREKDQPIVLIHPVGIGLSSWFWQNVMDSYEDNPPIYAPDLIGCGIDHGADAWFPEENGLFFPLSWVEGVETLMNAIVIPRWKDSQLPSLSNLFSDKQSSGGGCLVVAQGGLAPVGIMMAKRNPFNVGALMLTSPPTYTDVTTAIPREELQKNYNFLCSPILGRLAFSLLESREIIKFFSNLFLFQDECDEQWLDETQKEMCPQARTPVQAFNAGLLQHRSFEEELKEMPQQLVVVSGEGDKRVEDRQLYESELEKCTLRTIEGCNVMPWENPNDVIGLIKELGY